MRQKAVPFLVAILSAACGGSTLDVGGDGSSDGGPAVTTSVEPPPNGPALPDWPRLRECPADDGDSPFVGTWDGAAENFYFEPQFRVRLVIESASEETVCGHLLLGEDGSAPPPATDPEADYPPGVLVDFGVRDGPPPPIEGVRYSILGGAARDEALRFRTTWSEPYEGYCTLQSPLYDRGYERWQCLPEATQGLHVSILTQQCTLSMDTSSITTSITQCAACLNPLCACNETGCTASVEPTEGFDFSLEESAEGLVLSGTGADFPNGDLTLRLVRVESP